MFKERGLIVSLMLIFLVLSMTPTSSIAMPALFEETQIRTANDSPDTVPSEMKFVKEVDLLQSTSKIIYTWCYTRYGKSDIIVYSEEYNEATGTYYYVLSDVEKAGDTWQIRWQTPLDNPIVWGRVADVDGDFAPEVVTIPSIENITIIYDDDGKQLMNFTIPKYDRAIAIVDWTGDGVDDVILSLIHI